MENEHLPILGALIGESRVQEFFSEYWPAKHLAVDNDIGSLPECFRTRELYDFPALARRYSGRTYVANGAESPIMMPVQGKAEDLYRMGVTVFLHDVARYLPGANSLLKRMAVELKLPPDSTRMGIFASPRKSGLQTHYDVSDIFSIQLKGKKIFKIAPVKEIPFPCDSQYGSEELVFESLFPQATAGFPDWRNAQLETVEMNPGSVLYLPRGTWHCTEACDEESVSVSIGISVAPAVDSVLDLLRSVLIQDSRWRKPLYGAWSEDGASPQVKNDITELLQSLSKVSGSLTHDDLSLSMAPSTEKRFELLNRDSRFQKIPTTRVEIGQQSNGDSRGNTVFIKSTHSRYGDNLQLQIDDVMPEVCAVYQWVEEQKIPFTVTELNGQFPDLDKAAIRGVLESAVRSRLVNMLWFPKLN